jgi:hypothetical protein
MAQRAKKNGKRTGYRKRHKKSKVFAKHDPLESKPMKQIKKELSDAEKLLKEEEIVKKRIASAKKVAKRSKPLAHEGEIAGGMRYDWEKKRQKAREAKLAKKLAKEKLENPSRDKEITVGDATCGVLTSKSDDLVKKDGKIVSKSVVESKQSSKDSEEGVSKEGDVDVEKKTTLDSDEIEVMDLEELKKLHAQKVANCDTDEEEEEEFQSCDEEDVEGDEDVEMSQEEVEEGEQGEDSEAEAPELVSQEKKATATPEMIKEFLVAAAKGDFKAFKECLIVHKPLSLHSRDPKTGLTALLAACGKGETHIARWALGRGADPSVRCRRNGYNAMQYACHAGKTDLIMLLMERKKDIRKLCKSRSPSSGLGCLHALAMSNLDMDDPMCQGIIQSLRVFGAPRGPAGCPSAADVARRAKKSNAMVKAMI